MDPGPDQHGVLTRSERLRELIDAIVAATAHSVAAPVVVPTSDPDDLRSLCGPAIMIQPV